MLAGVLVAAAFHAAGCLSRPPAEIPPPPPATPAPQAKQPTQRFEATAYSIEGRTASGRRTAQGIVAADPKVLPLGARIRVSGAGPYSGVYTVADTGREVKGREIDIYVPDSDAARRFGRHTVEVELLDRGDGK